MAEREREKERERRWEEVKKRAHGATCRSCRWRQSRQTLRDCRDGGSGGYQALFREELASLSLKRNTVKSVFSPRENDWPCSAGDAPFYFSPTYPSLRLSLSCVTFSFTPLYSPLYLYSLSNFLYVLSAYFSRCASWDNRLTSCIWIVERLISGHSFTKYSYYTIAYHNYLLF